MPRRAKQRARVAITKHLLEGRIRIKKANEASALPAGFCRSHASIHTRSSYDELRMVHCMPLNKLGRIVIVIALDFPKQHNVTVSICISTSQFCPQIYAKLIFI
jgi:hypothetical protein